jgi:beta-galactosidase/beta-glucuronidase
MKTKTPVVFALAFICASAIAYSPVEGTMMTRWGKMVTPQNVWQEYPRPQFEREAWMNLNGLWNYAIQDKNAAAPERYQGEILVPFGLESALSGVGKELLPGQRLWYKRGFRLPAEWKGKRVIINFDAVDYEAVVYVNGAYVGSHKGAFDRFSFDITPYLKASGDQELVVSVDDPGSFGTQPRGKQRTPPGGIWYTEVSGIWQTVWLEAVSAEAWLKEARITPDIDAGTVEIIPLTNRPLFPGYTVKIDVSAKGGSIASETVRADWGGVLPVNDPVLWSPDNPFLYDVKLFLINPDGQVIDEVSSYFGMRKIGLGYRGGNKVIFLNNEPLFHYGTLDQGWWPDGLHTPPSDDAQRYDLEVTKDMGFNMIRKHIKVENDRWYHHCDKMGILVWQDMPSGMAVGHNEEGSPRSLQHVPGDGDDLHQRSEDAAQFEWELRRMMDLHYNSPSIVVWVPFNEGWGQYATCRIAGAVKAIDPTRLVNPVSGWALRPCGDIYSIHSYQVQVSIPPIDVNRASVLGEYGGIGYPVQGHLWNPEMRNWGYQTYHSAEELLDAYIFKFEQVAEMFRNKGLSAAVYTQTTDVEGEVNGLMTYDREVIKFPVEKMKEMHQVFFR